MLSNIVFVLCMISHCMLVVDGHKIHRLHFQLSNDHYYILSD